MNGETIMTGNNTTAMPSLSNHTLEMLQSKMLQHVLPAIYFFVFLVSTPLNLTSLWIFCRSQSKTPTMVFMINLTASDLAYGLVLPFLAVYHLRGNNWPFGDIFCSVTTILFYANVNCSVLTMLCISVERYVGIVHPLRFQNCMNIKKAFIICLLIWVLVLSIDSPFMYTKMTFFVHDLNILTCFDVFPKNMFSSPVLFYWYFACRVLAFFVIPIGTMVMCYLSIIVTLLRSHIQESGEPKKQTISTIVVLLIVLLLCFVPCNVILIAHSFPSAKQYSLYVTYKLFLALSGLNCCLDPFVYYFGSKEFQQKVKGRIYFLFHKNNVDKNMKIHTCEDIMTLS